ncbi:hypothetical protein CBS101457_000921 [Exobasidium rhododendri]|nr:hypothetical protein CBS101457_000921 [Exobasidium rhododendri]
MQVHRLCLLVASLVSLLAVEAQCNSGKVAKKMAGKDSEKQCLALASQFTSSNGLELTNTFSQYFGEGSMPSLEKLVNLYPASVIPEATNVPAILKSVGPDVDFKCDAGYAHTNSRAGQRAPAGGMPAFCRFGSYIKTSPLTSVFMEVWLPLASDPDIPLVALDPADFPTNTTGAIPRKDGTLEQAPLYVTKGQFTLPEPALEAGAPLAPNDVPVVKRKVAKTEGKASKSTAAPTDATPLKGSKEDVTKPTDKNQADSTLKLVKSASLYAKRQFQRHARRSPKMQIQEKSNRAMTGEEIIGEESGWNGRLAAAGNGAQRGFVPLPDLKQYMTRYNFAVMGNNGGHWSNATSVRWINGPHFTDTLTDFASRANHVSLLLSEEVIDAFYGKEEGVRLPKDNGRVARYYFGSSVGGGRGMSSIQLDPTDFNGHLIGAPAIDFAKLNLGQLATAKVHSKKQAGDGWFTQGALYGPIKSVVMSQCDELDGVKDGIISDPFKCKPKLEPELLCGGGGRFGGSKGTCLTQAQIDNAYKLYNETWLEGNFMYPAYLPGLEDSASSMNAANGKASGWTQLVILKQDELDPDFNGFTDIAYAPFAKGNADDPGKVNAASTDVSAYIKAGGKAILYHGLVDLVISPVATINYFEAVRKLFGADLDRSMKLYLIPGMQHSRGGRGAINMGLPTHRGCGNRPLKYDTDHDMTLALLAWVENGKEPKEQVAATYERREAFVPDQPTGKSASADIDLPITDTYQNYNWGLVNTRIHCPYPLMAKYKGGVATGEHSYASFVCA